ncbi:nuclear transport factor 2 family protein [Pseudoalteromonas sp. S16_S37]|uniref:nuclear transport factor 2 family protein n=1 Tax=Pseudoalteromonas sp. S16_S37 TaxID=2720228 RepID=UPI0016805BED|nr:nuclear transport factor 2 family protein [Pseudoalteromonas sp. S16_S37]MBD1582627.1 SnoaL-like domain-containing protein [Pseudoalteromonas sp. S16_S37]
MKTKLATFIIPLMIMLSGCQSVSLPSKSEIALCEKTIIDYVQFRDQGPIESYQALFSKDATFIIPKLGVSLSSDEQIAARAKQAMANKKTIHMITSTAIVPNSKNEFSSTAHFILYMSDKKDKSIPTKVFNGRYVDLLVLNNNRCLIKNREVFIDRVDTLD